MIIKAKESTITIDGKKFETSPPSAPIEIPSATIQIPIADSDGFDKLAACLLADNLENMLDAVIGIILKDNKLNIDDLSRSKNISRGTVEIFHGDDMLVEIFEPVYDLGNVSINYRKFY